MKTMTRFFSLAALLLAAAGFSACSSDSNTVIDQPEVTPAPKTYSVSIDAAKGDDGSISRALSLDGDNLTSAWAQGEEVTVYNITQGAELEGTLTAQASGANTTLAGTLTGDIAADDELLLKFCSDSYNSQDGTLAYISQNCDYATATVTVDNVTESAFFVAGAANFVNQQAIIKFTLKDKGNSDALINPSAFTITDGTTTVTLSNIPDGTYTTNGNGVLFVAFPAAGTAKTITLTATVGSDTYTYERADVIFTNSEFWTIPVKMTKVVLFDANGYDYVDLGITNANGEKLLWAKKNVGADSETECGSLYQWGSLVDCANLNCNQHLYAATGLYSSGKYICYTGTDEAAGYGSQLQLAHDVAYQTWGGDWVMPTKADVEALIAAYPKTNTTGQKRSAWTTVSGVNGLAFYAEDNTLLLFLPAAGIRSNTYTLSANYCYYWTSTLNTEQTDNSQAYVLKGSSSAFNTSSSIRQNGLPVRPVIRYKE